eukprot:scaffold329971_cov15-Prasinocladus_malaysianus.AAC.1
MQLINWKQPQCLAKLLMTISHLAHSASMNMRIVGRLCQRQPIPDVGGKPRWVAASKSLLEGLHAFSYLTFRYWRGRCMHTCMHDEYVVALMSSSLFARAIHSVTEDAVGSSLAVLKNLIVALLHHPPSPVAPPTHPSIANDKSIVG